MSDEDIKEKQLGINNKQVVQLKELSDVKKFPDTPFSRQGAAFRFAFALGLERGLKIERDKRKNIFQWSQVFGDAGIQEIKNLIKTVSGDHTNDVTKAIEEYAAWGVNFMHTNGYHQGMEMNILDEYESRLEKSE